MGTTVVALYRDEKDAKSARDEAKRENVGKVDLVKPNQRNPDIEGYGIPSDAARTYERGLEKGLYMVAVRSDSSEANRAGRILDRHHPVDLDDALAVGGGRPIGGATPARAGREQGDQSIPVVEEDVRVGKRTVEEGGVRVQTHVVEEPVRENVRLREEHVDVSRRKADRPAGEADFQNRTVEASEMREEAVVDKRARVVEEIVISKSADVREEEIRDTVRRTEVEIQRLGVEGDFRSHYDREYGSRGGYDYEQLKPAYRYGSYLAQHEDYRGRSWSDVEPEAKRHYERRNPGSWDKFKSAVRHGFERTRGAVTP